MENLTKLGATIVSHAGSVLTGINDDFSMNGRTKYKYEPGNIQVSIDKCDKEYIFAVFDEIDGEMVDVKTKISMAKELKHFQEQLKSSERNIENKLNQFGEFAREANNLIYSSSLGEPDGKGIRTAFAGLLISGNKAAAVSVGTNRIYILRNGSLRHMTADYSKTERLLKLGIITQEQALALATRFGITAEGSSDELMMSEVYDINTKDIFLICSKGLAENVDGEEIQDILLDSSDSSIASNRLIREALKKEAECDITALVIMVDGLKDENAVAFNGNKVQTERLVKQIKTPDKKKESHKTYIAAIITSLILIGIIIAACKIWLDSYKNEEFANVSETVPTEYTTPPETVNDEGETAQEGAAVAEKGQSDTSDQTPAPEKTPVPDKKSNTAEISQLKKYTVKEGDSLYSISLKFYNNIEKIDLIKELNDIENENLIKIGQIIILP